MKKKIIIIPIIFVFILIVLFIVFKFKKNINNEAVDINITDLVDDEVDRYYLNLKAKNIKKNATREEREKLFYYFNNPRVAIYEMCKKNGDWSLIPVDDSVFEEYNEKDGILKNIKFDSIENVDDGYDFGMAKIIVTSGKKRTKYIIEYLLDFEIRNIKIFEKIDLTDENGNNLDTRYKFEGDQIRYNFLTLRYDGQEEGGEIIGSDVAVTDNFRKKYPYFLDLFIHYSPLEYNHVELLDLNIEKQIATFEVDSLLECKKRTYEVKYKLTDDLYLDDVEVSKINEIDTEATNDNRTSKLLYQHSNWKELELTDNFLSNHKNDNGIVPLIDEINVDAAMEEIQLFAKDYYKYIYKFKLKNNNDLVYFVEIVCDDKGKIDQIMFNELPYTNISINEAKTKFLEDIELQKESGIEID